MGYYHYCFHYYLILALSQGSLKANLITVLQCSLEPEVKETTKKEMTVLDVGGKLQRNILGKTHTIKQGLTTQFT